MSKKKKDKKIKKKEKQQSIVQAKKLKYDIIQLLKNERQDSKPNLGKFLKDYVKQIRGCNDGRIALYPSFKYEISKIIVDFFDGHQLIFVKKGIKGPEYYLYDELDEIEIKTKDLEIIEKFFEFLKQFKFI